ncbi:hypothetical protein Tco_0430208 [Tanacetum coccineum]
MRLGIALGPGYEVGESSAAAAARPAEGVTQRDMLDMGSRIGGMRLLRPYKELQLVLTHSWVYTHVRDFESMVRRDTYEIYTMLDDEQSQRQLLASRVNMLFRDRRG